MTYKTSPKKEKKRKSAKDQSNPFWTSSKGYNAPVPTKGNNIFNMEKGAKGGTIYKGKGISKGTGITKGKGAYIVWR